MSFKVRLAPSGREFCTASGETVLDAALRQGISLPYGCRGGACGACKGKIVAGEVSYPGGGLPLGLSEAEAAVGQSLLCQAYAQSDLEIEVREIGAARELAPRTLTTRVAALERLSPEVMRVQLQLPEGERLQFLAGQYIDILMKDGRRRAFSLANAPHDDRFLELHIRRIEDGRFTEHVFSDMRENDLLRIEGPHGDFYLREDSERPIIFLAGGTGFAPIKGILEHAFAEGLQRPMQLYWGVRSKAHLYLDAQARGWAGRHGNFGYEPVLSEPEPTDAWQGRSGLAHEAVLADHHDLSGFDVYASGPPAMVRSAAQAFTARGLPAERYFSDAFEFAND